MGEVFAGRYELLELIGQGGMGSVWQVHDRRTDQIVAAKVLRQSDAASLLRFVRETAFRVQHPHVVTPLGWAGEDDRVLFTMPIVDGGSVATVVGDHGPLPARFVAEILRQLLDALGAVHASRIVHRDVKPANVLLRATGAARPHAYLSDFGIAVELDGPRLTETNVVIGTPGYMAPEQRRGELTTASDLYAAGAVARYMLTALPPDDPAGEHRPDEVPAVLWGLTTALLASDPAQRPDVPAALAWLEAPELAWTPGAAGEVDVLQQVEGPDGRSEVLEPPTTVQVRRPPDEGREPPPPPEQPATGAPAAEAPATEGPVAPAPATEGPVAPAPATAGPGRRRGLVAAGGGAALVALLAAAVILWSPWSGGAPAEDETATDPPASTSSTSSTSSSTSTTPSSTTSSSSTTGSLEVGTVVTRVGQPCGFTDVGLRETTTGGTEVVCRQGDDGDYSWEEAP